MTSFEMEIGLITFENDGSVSLLPGYKFDPTDEVLVDFYLKRRVFSQHLPVQIIPDFNVFQTEPWGLPGGDGNIFSECKFFFYNPMKRDLTNLYMRVAGSGQWKVVEKGKDIPIPQNNKVVGKRNTLIFWEAKGVSTRRTNWVMHEFRLVLIDNPSKMTKWAVYRIFQKNDEKKVKKTRGSKEGNSNGGKNGASVEAIDFNESGNSQALPFLK
ncbi:NAC domain-containing protein 83-like [Lotus japonicus]|uniref:NAC domain-containing protein 83-like n=1 Tax=Lotus japonicus TaxID=34305 RepID=UPI0025849AEC|nr:NAC domain-containing protein 83-like [Lotus japonicus]